MTTTAPRFAGLQTALADISAENHTRIARIRAVAKGEAFTGRLGTTKPTATTAATAAKPAPRPTPAPAAKPAAAAPPPRKLGRTETVALALKTDPKLAGMQDIALHALDDPDLKALSGDGMVRVLRGIDATAYRATMAEQERKARVAKADAVWSRAIAAVHGPSRDAAADRPQQASTSGNDKAADIWGRAWAKVTGQQEPAR